MKPADPILIFDSGVGGLSILAEVRRILPGAPIVYAADMAALPYGEKSEAELAARVPALLGRMVERFRPRLVTIACNTASTIALAAVREALDVPVVGTVPAIKPAAAMTKTGTIGLLGTAATIRQSYVDNLEREFANGKKLLRHAAPELVGAAEAKLRGQRVLDSAVESAVAGLRAQVGGADIDTVVLACTHFPLLVTELADKFGRDVRFVDGACGIARRIAYLTQDQVFKRESPDFMVVTGDKEGLHDLMPALESYGLAEIRRF
ncbi:glutamate racemase [Altererythrobacter aquiaggeris]|uniref:glutamate racemase n=1 Tax=Aestuarierythrobacter aquiaggeris TaxID=1898396 RepID=UPI003017AA31